MFLLMFGHHEEEQVRPAPGRCSPPLHSLRGVCAPAPGGPTDRACVRSMASWRASR